MNGSVAGGHGDGLFWSDIMKLKMCASDMKSCLEDDAMLKDICSHFTIGDMNPDVEGDSNTWNDGLKAIKNIVLDRPMNSSRRILEESKLDSLISAAEKINLHSVRNFKIYDMFDLERRRLLKSTVVTKSSNGSGSSGSSGSATQES